MALTITAQALRENAAADLGLMLKAKVEAVPASDQATISKLTDVSPDPERMRDSFILESGAVPATATRRIIAMQGDIITTSHAHGLAVDDEVRIYFLLTPEEMQAAIDEDIKKEWTRTRHEVTLLSTTNEYELPTWIQSKQQVEGVEFRDASDSTYIIEEPAVAYQLIETANIVTLRLIFVPSNIANIKAIIHARKFFTAFASEAATTTMPEPWAVRMAQVAIVHKAFSKHGQALKRLFGQEVVLAERELVKLRATFVPPYVARDYRADTHLETHQIGLEPERLGW